MNESRCLVCGEPEWGNVCAICAAQGWTDKAVMQAIVGILSRG